MKIISWFFLIGFFLVSVFGCSLFSSKEDAPVVLAKPEPKPIAMAPKAPPKRELGSLWSDTSAWNNFYGSRAGKSVGEMVMIRPTDGFRLRVTQVAVPTAVEAPKEGDTLNRKENNNIVATIADALPNSVYLVSARQNMRINQKDYWVELNGKLREQSVLAETELSSDDLFDVSLEVKGPPLPPPTEPAKVANQKPGEGDKTKEAKEAPKEVVADNDVRRRS